VLRTRCSTRHSSVYTLPRHFPGEELEELEENQGTNETGDEENVKDWIAEVDASNHDEEEF
jgi:hypothetical protein